MKKTALTLILACCAAMTSAAPSILTLKHSITDHSIVYPESFETDTHKMLQNWYIKNYTILDQGLSAQPDVNVSDDVLIQRLSLLPTTIELPYNQIVRSYIDMYTQRRRQLVETMLGMSLYYMPIFEQALERKGLPLELRFLPVIESALNPDAVSRAGATGLWQFMLPTARGLGLEVNTLVDERRDPYASSEAAATYLKQLHDMYNDWSLAIAAYNCGPGNVNKALRRAGLEDSKNKDFWSIYYLLPAETRGYVPAFIAATYVMNYYKQHNISPALAKRPIITDSIHINKRVNFHQIADVLDMPVEEIRVLNPQYRKDIIPGDMRPYPLVLPSMQVHCYIMSEDSIVSHDERLYTRRKVVEPMSGEDENGQYITKLVTKTHTVKRGETLAKIAAAYGVTTSDIKKLNRLRSNRVSRGRKLKINTWQRVPNPDYKAPGQAAADDNSTLLASTDNAAASPANESEPAARPAEASADATANEKPAAPATKPAAAKAKDQKPAAKTTKPKATESKPKAQKAASGKNKIHVVKKGENLYAIAKKYKGVSADDIQRANKLPNPNIRPGQKLTIPGQ